MDATRRTVSVIVRGRVQGVGYRFWTRVEAERRGLAGYVRNRVDGTVEALVSGPAEAVAVMLDACRRGPSAAQVTAVEVTEGAVPPADPGFAIR